MTKSICLTFMQKRSIISKEASIIGTITSMILVLNGPNLNLLGTREPDRYGLESLEQTVQKLTQLAEKQGFELKSFQSNAEHELVEKIQKAVVDKVEFILLNPAAFTHSSVALRDALLAVAVPFIEIHLSNIYAREEFRHKSYFSDIAAGVVAGFGTLGYELALRAAITKLQG